MGKSSEAGAAQRGVAYITLDQEDACNYYFGRLVWSNVATLADIDDWVYSMAQMNTLHDILDLRETIEDKKEALAHG